MVSVLVAGSLVIAALLYSAVVITEIVRLFLILLALLVVGPFYAIFQTPLPTELTSPRPIVLSDLNPEWSDCFLIVWAQMSLGWAIMLVNATSYQRIT
jgi:hypothetical protein